MIRRLLATIEPYVLMLLATVLIATLLPPRGVGVPFFDIVADTAIVALFFVHGAKLSRSALLAGARHLRLHAAILATSFVIFPLLGLVIGGLAAPNLATGLLFLTLLPSTVQSSIAFTAIARGNVAAAVCSASLSNLLGIAVTPALAACCCLARAGSRCRSIRCAPSCCNCWCRSRRGICCARGSASGSRRASGWSPRWIAGRSCWSSIPRSARR